MDDDHNALIESFCICQAGQCSVEETFPLTEELLT